MTETTAFRKELAPSYSAYNPQTRSMNFGERLRNAVDKRASYGIEGIGEFKVGGVKGSHVDRTNLVFRGFYMTDEMYKLLTALDEKGHDLNVDVCAAWLSNCEIKEDDFNVRISSTCDFMRQNIVHKFNDCFRKYFKEKPIKYEVSTALKKKMHREI